MDLSLCASGIFRKIRPGQEHPVVNLPHRSLADLTRELPVHPLAGLLLVEPGHVLPSAEASIDWLDAVSHRFTLRASVPSCLRASSRSIHAGLFPGHPPIELQPIAEAAKEECRGLAGDAPPDWIGLRLPDQAVIPVADEQGLHPDTSIDTLLSSPTDAAKMGASVAVMLGDLNGAECRKILKHIRAIEKIQGAVDAIDGVCRAALSSRKRGDFRKGA